MAALFSEDFEGGSNGATLSTGNTSCALISGSPTFTNSLVITGGLAMYVKTTSNVAGGGRFDFSAAPVVYYRLYVYFNALPGSATTLAQVLSSGTVRGELRYDPTGNSGAGSFQLRNATTNVWRSTTVPATGKWYRLEWRVSNTASQQQCRVFIDGNKHGVTADEDSGNRTYNTGTFNQARIGTSTALNGMDHVFDAVETDTATWVGPAVVSQDATLTSSVATATASGGSTAFTGDARLASSTATATAAGGEGALHGQAHATLTSSTGTATAAGGSTTLHGDAVLASSAGTATASGGDGSMSGSGTGTLTGDTGAATASGGDSTLHGDARLTATTASATASGGTGTMTGQAHATLTSTTGTAAASGGDGTLRGGATLSAADPGDATADGGTSTLHGAATLTATTGTATADGETGLLRVDAVLTSDTGDAVADGGQGSMHAYVPRDITLTGTLAPRRVTGDLEARHGGALTAADRDGALTTTRRGGLAPAHRRTGRIEHT